MRIAYLAASVTAAGVLVLAGTAPVFADPTDPSEPPTPTPTVTVTDTTPPATETPTPTPTDTPPAPKFDADITPHVFSPGDKLTLTTTGCPTVPNVEDVDGLFTGALALKEVAEGQHEGSAVTKTSLSATKTYRVVVTCANVGTVTFEAAPGKKTTKHESGQTGVVPLGGMQTGDGSSLGGGNGTALTLAGGAAGLAAMTALTLAYRRRKAHEDA
jgi:hypothetical protein